MTMMERNCRIARFFARRIDVMVGVIALSRLEPGTLGPNSDTLPLHHRRDGSYDLQEAIEFCEEAVASALDKDWVRLIADISG